ncbi:RNA-binding domain-containing protein, partial [Bacteroides fragilis]
MNIEELKVKAENIVENIKDKGIYLKENTFIDYKLELKLSPNVSNVLIFLRNFAKDILAFANKDGGLLLLGFNENKETGEITDIGLKEDDIN